MRSTRRVKLLFGRAILYLSILALVASMIHLYTARGWSKAKLLYRSEALFLSFNVRCDDGAPADLRRMLKRESLPYFSHTGQVIYIDAFGEQYECRVVPKAEPHNIYSFRLASTTKALTALAFLELSEKVGTDLDTALVDFFPEVDQEGLRDERLMLVTLNHLLGHSSGFGGPFGSDNMMNKGERPWCPNDFKQLETVRLAGIPGTNHLYSNVAYCLLGEVMARLSGESYRDYMRKNYLSEYPTLDFVDGDFLASEPEYDFTHAYRLGREYVEWFDFHAISSSAGLIGNPAELAHLVWTLNQRNPGMIFNGPRIEQCENKGLGRCYSYTFVLEGGQNGDFHVATQQGYMPGASSLLAISSSGEVIVWTAAGAPADNKYKQRLVDEVVKFFNVTRASE